MVGDAGWLPLQQLYISISNTSYVPCCSPLIPLLYSILHSQRSRWSRFYDCWTQGRSFAYDHRWPLYFTNCKQNCTYIIKDVEDMKVYCTNFNNFHEIDLAQRRLQDRVRGGGGAGPSCALFFQILMPSLFYYSFINWTSYFKRAFTKMIFLYFL